MGESRRELLQRLEAWLDLSFGACCLDVRTLTFLPTINGFSIKPLKVKLLAGEQKAAESGSGFWLYIGRFETDVVWLKAGSPTSPNRTV